MSSTSAWLVLLATGEDTHIGEFVSTPLARGRALFLIDISRSGTKQLPKLPRSRTSLDGIGKSGRLEIQTIRGSV
jgi:hypothetical protein